MKNDEVEINITENTSSEDNINTQSNDLKNSQLQKFQTRSENILTSLQNTAITKYPVFQIPDLSGIRSFYNNYQAMQIKMAEIVKPLLDTQKLINKAISDMYAPMRYIVEMVKTINQGYENIFRPLKQKLRIVEILKNNQFVIWYVLNVAEDEDIEKLDSDLINSIMLGHFSENDSQQLNTLIVNCRTSLQNRPGYTLFEQSVFSMLRGEYHTAIIGFTSTLDGLLTLYSGCDNTSVRRRLEILNTKLLEQTDSFELSEDINEYWLYSSLFTVIDSFAVNAPFEKPEPELLNRHWLMHGRSKRNYTLIDCIKVLSMIYGMILVGDLSKNKEQ